MTELTMCMWLYANDGYSNEHIVSYAIDGKCCCIENINRLAVTCLNEFRL